MLVQNRTEILSIGSNTKRRKNCLDILEAGLEAADPTDIISRHIKDGYITINGNKVIDCSAYSAVYTIAFGKAADTMTRTLNATIQVRGGVIVIPRGSKSVIKGSKFKIFNSGHPVPDHSSVKAAKEITKFLGNRRDGELVIFLVSGGGSALLAMPDGITLGEKVHATNMLLKSGASIQEINCVRKHISKIKGGKLVANMRCHGISLVMSDVQGDDLSVIASGTTYKDDTTHKDALDILDKYSLTRKLSKDIMRTLRRGAQRDPKLQNDNYNKDTASTTKIDTVPCIPPNSIENYVIANNAQCLVAMQQMAKSLGYTSIITLQVFGDIKEAIKKILAEIPEASNKCVIFGGEPTVKVLGKGIGGRNQEMVLRILKNTRRRKGRRLVIASMGTDGIDGNSEYAGAITENADVNLAKIVDALRRSDSSRFFQKRNECIMTGRTHTNLMDIGVILT